MGEQRAFDSRELSAAGWRRRSVASEPRLSEAVSMYRNLGYEVLLVPVLREGAAEGSGGSCTACFDADASPERYRVIYTRPREGATDETDDLFE